MPRCRGIVDTVAPSVRRAARLTLAAGLDEADDRLEQDLVILPFFVLPPRTRDDDSAPLVFDVTDDVSDDDKLPELSDSLPFSAGVPGVKDCLRALVG